jgi:hypothetical protein
VYDCSFSAPALTPAANGCTQIAVRDCSAAAQPGAPQLPFRTVKLLLPADTSVRSVTAEPLSVPVILDGIWKIDFGRTPRSPVAAAAGEDRPDPVIYNSTNLFPAAAVEQVSVQRMDGHDIVILRVFPVRYAPVPGRLVFTPDLRITVSLNTATGSLLYSASVAAPSPGVQARLAAFVDNPPELIPNSAPFLALSAPLATVEADAPSAYDYLIVSSAELMPYFQPLVDLKIAQGLSVKTDTMANITTNYTGANEAEKLRNFIRYAHSTWGVQYVLLGGDNNVVPHRGVYGYVSATEMDAAIPSDLYFACLEGSWNHDGDSLWGEPTDGETGGDVNLIAEVYVGRAPVATAAEVTNFVAKTIASQTGSSGNFRAVFAAEYLDTQGSQGGDALDYILPAFSNSRCRTEWLDDRPQLVSTWNASNIISLLNRSPLFVAHSGHADFYTVMQLQKTDLDLLTNQMPFLFYSTGCNPGQFDNPSQSSDSIGEEFIKRNQYGAFSAVLNSRFGWYDEQSEWKYSGEFQAEFFNSLLRAGRSVVGKADRQSREALIGKIETSGSMPYRWCYFNLILFGDPHAAVEVPVTLTLPFINSAEMNCVIEWNSLTNNCSLYRTTNLTGQSWICIASNMVPTPPLNTWTNTTTEINHAFYRVIED